MSTEITQSTMEPRKSETFLDKAETLLANFPGVDRADLLTTVTALYLMDLRYGNKREERAACDFLNLVQEKAVQQLKELAADKKSG